MPVSIPYQFVIGLDVTCPLANCPLTESATSLFGEQMTETSTSPVKSDISERWTSGSFSCQSDTSSLGNDITSVEELAAPISFTVSEQLIVWFVDVFSIYNHYGTQQQEAMIVSEMILSKLLDGLQDTALSIFAILG